MADVTMPKLSDTMEEGKILRWLKQAGDRVEVGDLLLEVETDKADMEVEASTAGVLRELKLGEGDTAPVGALIAVIDAGGEPPKGAAPAPASAGKADVAPRAARKQPDAPAAPPAAPAAAARNAVAAPAPAAPARGAHEVKASPLARTLAEQLGVDLGAVRGTGPAGRVTRRDVEEAQARAARPAAVATAGGNSGAAARAASAAPGRTPAEPVAGQVPPEREVLEGAPAASGGVRRVPLTRMRAAIAKRMAESTRTAPHFYLTTSVDMDEAVRLRAQLKTLEVSAVGVTYNHMIIKAVADALVDCPEINARFAGEAIELLDEINIGIATAVDDGLIVPVLQRADRASLLEIAAQARALADKAESGRFSSAELSGATFSVSNLGMFDVDSFSAVINPPQAAILAVGSVKQRAVVRDGALAVAHTMALTLSCDHRVVDGARGGRFLAEVKRRLENPASLLLSTGGAAR